MEIPSTTTKTFTPIAVTTMRGVQDRRDKALDRLAARLARRGAPLQRHHMPARVAGQAPEGPQRAHTTLPARGLIGQAALVEPNQHSPKRVPSLQTRVWEGRPLQGGRRPEGGARGKVAL